MSLPNGWTALPLDATRGVPQSASLPGPVPGLRVSLVAAAGDLARLLSAPSDLVVHDVQARRAPVPAAEPDGPLPAGHVVARRTALAAFTTAPPDSLTTPGVPVTLVVTEAAGVCGTWPALPGRALPVRSRDGRLLGQLWVDELSLAAGSLVSAGPCGARIVVGWRAAVGPLATATNPATGQEDPYVGLV